MSYEFEVPEDIPVIVRAEYCKKIVPNNGREVKIGRKIFSALYPRIVKTDFKTPADWEEIERVEDGQELDFGKFHTCKRSPQDNDTVNGYYVHVSRQSAIRIVSIPPNYLD